MLTSSSQTLLLTALTGVLAYLGLVLVLRISGKRTLAKLNAFDFVVTVALGSTLASVLVSKGVALVQGLVAFVTLIGLQYVVAWSSVRFPLVRRIARSRPVALVIDGEYQPDAMHAERVTRSEVAQAMRREGRGSVRDVTAVVLETDGSLSILTGGEDLSTMDDVAGWPASDRR